MSAAALRAGGAAAHRPADLPQLLPALLPALLLAFLCALMAAAVLRMPPAWQPARIDVRLAPGAAIELGRSELAAPRAAVRALVLRRDAAGHWWAASANAAQPLVLERGDARSRSGVLPLQAGARFQLGARAYLVTGAGPGHLALADGEHAWHYDGATLRRDGAPQPACPGTGTGARLKAWWSRAVPATLAPAQALRLGGSLDCGNRIGNPDVAAGSASIDMDDGRPMLAAGPGSLPLFATVDGLPRELALAPVPLAGVTALTVAGTRMRIAALGPALQLAPASRVSLYAQARVALPPGVAWEWARRDAWALPPRAALVAGLAVAGGLLAGSLAWRAARRRQAFPALACALGAALAVLGLGLLLAARLGGAPGVAVSLLPAWAALAYTLACVRSGAARLVASCAVLLLAAGLLLQLELGTGAPDSSWLRHVHKTAAATTLGLGLLGTWTWWPRAAPAAPARVEAALLALAALAVCALLAQVGWGNETGVFDLQPVELAKLALAALCAHCIALGLGGATERGRSRRRWLRLVAPALLFSTLLAVALVQVDDYSPLVLLLVWAAAMLLAWSCATRRRGGVLAVGSLACACLAALVLLRALSPAEAQAWDFYGERFGAWLDPVAHPHTGAQVLQGAQAIGAGGWSGADGVFGLAAPGQGAAAALAIPAVQDDFAPSFLLARHGLAAGLALWLLQALFLAALLRTATRSWQAAAQARNYHDAWRGRFRCFLLCGGGAFVLGHFLLSWGTNLAFFPVMGQPMSFLSAGGSHLLFFIFPLLAVAAAGEPTFEEN